MRVQAEARRSGSPVALVAETSIQIRSTVALALAAPANPTRAATLPTAATANTIDLIIAPTPPPVPVCACTETRVNFFLRLWGAVVDSAQPSATGPITKSRKSAKLFYFRPLRFRASGFESRLGRPPRCLPAVSFLNFPYPTRMAVARLRDGNPWTERLTLEREEEENLGVTRRTTGRKYR
jgi:hypothetical protein